MGTEFAMRMRGIKARWATIASSCVSIQAQASYLSRRCSQYRGPGGLTATEIFDKVREASARDEEHKRRHEPRPLSELTPAELLAMIKETCIPAHEILGVVEKDELVRIAQRHGLKAKSIAELERARTGSTTKSGSWDDAAAP